MIRRLFSTIKVVKESQTELGKILTSSIKAGGPLTTAHYMRMCLTHPIHGYYMQRDVFGKDGDFTTSPEISQTFGELLAVFIINELQHYSCDNIHIAELGPGRGTLMSDILRTIQQFPETYKRIKIVSMIDASPYLKSVQRNSLQEFSKDLEFDWFDRIQELPKNRFTIYLAHEFFDSLPVYLFKKTDKGWREIMVDIDNESELNFRQILALEPTKSLLLLEYQSHLKDRELDSVIQISPDTIDITSEIAKRIHESGGFGLFADYGSEIITTDRMRGIQNHNWISPFSFPGKVDLSSDVEFSSLNIAAEKQDIAFHGPKTQREFLLGLGMGYRVKRLLEAVKNEEQKTDLLRAVERLVSPNQMGNAYKFCVLTQKGHIPFGFE